MTADCLPLLVCDRRGSAVAAVHAGWRGLAAGVIESALTALGGAPADLLAWLGPAIGPSAFEVGPEVRDALLAADPAVASAFQPGAGDRWLADLFALARSRLTRAGVTQIFGGGDCTWSDPDRFYSFRRDGVTGRMASLIWMSAPE
jgi:YfiH family protein